MSQHLCRMDAGDVRWKEFEFKTWQLLLQSVHISLVEFPREMEDGAHVKIESHLTNLLIMSLA